MSKVTLPDIPEYLTTNRLIYYADDKEINLHNVKIYLNNPFEILIEAEGDETGDIKGYPDYRSPLKFPTDEGWDVEIDNIFINNVRTHIEVRKPIEVKVTGDTTKLRAVKGALGEDEDVEVYLPIGDFHWYSGQDPENPIFRLGYLHFEPEPLANTKLCELNQPNIEGYSAALVYRGLLNTARAFIGKTWDDFYCLISLGLGRWATASHKFIHYRNALEVEIIPGLKQKAFYGPLQFYGQNKIETYINPCFDSYLKYKTELDFKKLIDWYILMNQTSSLHLKFLIGVVLLEALKYAYAKNIIRNCEKKDCPFVNAGGKSYAPKRLLKAIKKQFRVEDGRFVKLFEKFRNQIIHEGGFSENSDFRFRDAFILQNSIAKLLFKILGYEGEIEEQEFCEF